MSFLSGMQKLFSAKNLTIVTLTTILGSPLANAQFVHTNGTDILDEDGNKLFLSGINLGNWLVWEGYLMMGDFNYRTHTQFFNSLSDALGGDDAAAEFEYQWRLNYVDEQAIADIKALGFNSVRVPFNYKLFWENGQLKDDGFEFFDRVIDWCRTHDIYVLLDMHGAPGYQNPGDHADNNDSNADQPRDTVKFWDGNNVEIAATIWRHIADRYKDESVVWGYDLINEPVPQPGREYELLPSMVTMRDAIREVDNNHIIVAEGNWWSSDLTILDWTDPQVQSTSGITSQWDDNLVYQLHHYGPVEDTLGREDLTNRLNIPVILGEYGETDNANLQAITNWSKQELAGYFPWSFKKMSHDRTLWTIPSNSAYDEVKNFINNGGTPPTHLYVDMIDFAKNNTRNGHNSHHWHQDFYDGVKPDQEDSPASDCSNSGITMTIAGKVEAEYFCEQDGIQTENTSDTDGGENIGYIDNGDWAEYRVNVSESGDYTLKARVASEGSGGAFDVLVGSNLVATINVPNTGGWQNFTDVTTTATLTAGENILRLNFNSSGININWLEFYGVSPAPTPTPTPTPTQEPTATPTPTPTAPPVSSLEDGTYYITNVASGKAFDVAGVATHNGANVQQWSYSGGLNQQWVIQNVSGDSFTLISVNSNACLDVDLNSKNIQQWECTGSTNQTWTLDLQTNGTYIIRSSNNETVEVEGNSGSDGANIKTSTSTNGSNQRWNFNSVN